MTGTGALSPSDDETVDRRVDCALTDLEVGEIPIPAQSSLTITLVLLQIFPGILNVKHTNRERKVVGKTIKDFRRIRSLVNRTRPAYYTLSDP